ncbi:MAG TPA: 1-acyl-sn-glycerol-3-phosphate acyltransferase [Gammaproteobacteria bacterium]|nr:1-acyl-sn-glycerol-3-phosphate acyltransferase [Gammaproteobacteria bacterium]
MYSRLGPWRYLQQFIGSTAFWLGATLLICLFLVPMWFTLLFPLKRRFQIARQWNKSVLTWLKWTCGLGYRVEGREHLPETPCVILAKHQSTWETFSIFLEFAPTVYVLKRELTWLPIFGWAIAPLHFISIDRSTGKKALNHILAQGKKCVENQLHITIIPEGTRTSPGSTHEYKKGGAILAKSLNLPVVPIAHNAGQYWPKHSYIKLPGTITVRVGLPIDTTERSIHEINALTQSWIETQMTELDKL